MPPPAAPAHVVDSALTGIFVGGLPWWTTDSALRTLCREAAGAHGAVREVRIYEDRVCGRSLGYAFVDFTTGAAAAAAKPALNGKVVDGSSVVVVIATQAPQLGQFGAGPPLAITTAVNAAKGIPNGPAAAAAAAAAAYMPPGYGAAPLPPVLADGQANTLRTRA
eukprot:PRCOL_00001764-RA